MDRLKRRLGRTCEEASEHARSRAPGASFRHGKERHGTLVVCGARPRNARERRAKTHLPAQTTQRQRLLAVCSRHCTIRRESRQQIVRGQQIDTKSAPFLKKQLLFGSHNVCTKAKTCIYRMFPCLSLTGWIVHRFNYTDSPLYRLIQPTSKSKATLRFASAASRNRPIECA